MAFRNAPVLALAVLAGCAAAITTVGAQNLDAALKMAAPAPVERSAPIASLNVPAAPRVSAPIAEPAPALPTTASEKPVKEALANGLTPVTLQDPNQQPYVSVPAPTVLPPIRPSAVDSRARAERQRIAQQVREANAARSVPVRAADIAQPQRRRTDCATSRCPNLNMLGIHY